jgi:signal peptidase II
MKRVPGNRYFVFLLIAGAGLSLDLVSKHVVFTDLGYPGGVQTLKAGEHERFDHPELIEGESRYYIDGWVQFRLYTSFNRGALWGVGQNATYVFTTASIIAATGILVWLFLMGGAESRWLTVCLAFIMAGTLGNLWDRLALHGCTDFNGEPLHAVRDFFLFTFGGWNYPIFNFADVFLVSGAIMLVVQSLFLMPQEAGEGHGASAERQSAIGGAADAGREASRPVA